MLDKASLPGLAGNSCCGSGRAENSGGYCQAQHAAGATPMTGEKGGSCLSEKARGGQRGCRRTGGFGALSKRPGCPRGYPRVGTYKGGLRRVERPCGVELESLTVGARRAASQRCKGGRRAEIRWEEVEVVVVEERVAFGGSVGLARVEETMMGRPEREVPKDGGQLNACGTAEGPQREGNFILPRPRRAISPSAEAENGLLTPHRQPALPPPPARTPRPPNPHVRPLILIGIDRRIQKGARRDQRGRFHHCSFDISESAPRRPPPGNAPPTRISPSLGGAPV